VLRLTLRDARAQAEPPGCPATGLQAAAGLGAGTVKG
jgi:hypothetical protein